MEDVKRLEVYLPRSTDFTTTFLRGYDASGREVVSQRYGKQVFRLADCFAELRRRYPNAEITEA